MWVWLLKLCALKAKLLTFLLDDHSDKVSILARLDGCKIKLWEFIITAKISFCHSIQPRIDLFYTLLGDKFNVILWQKWWSVSQSATQDSHFALTRFNLCFLNGALTNYNGPFNYVISLIRFTVAVFVPNTCNYAWT